MIKDFDRSLVSMRNEELRREAQMWHLENRLRASRERRSAVRRSFEDWRRRRKFAPADQ